MINLFAVPFDTYTSSKTEQGVVYNLVDKHMKCYAQCWVAHRPYADHDLFLEDISGAPNNVKTKLKEVLDEMLGEWKVLTRFSFQMTRGTNILTEFIFDERCKGVWYDPVKHEIGVKKPLEIAKNGIVY